MKKGFCSSIVIISTITTCTLMNIILNDESYENRTEEKLIEIKESKSTSNKPQNNEKSKEKVKESNKANEVKPEVDKLKVTENLPIPQKDASRASHKDYFMEVEGYKGEDIDYEASEYKSVFKVDSRTIVSDLSMMDKLKLLSISTKLSKVDYKKIDGYLKEDNAEEGVKKAYEILKERLNDKDLDKIKGILERYIDVNVIEKKQ